MVSLKDGDRVEVVSQYPRSHQARDTAANDDSVSPQGDSPYPSSFSFFPSESTVNSNMTANARRSPVAAQTRCFGFAQIRKRAAVRWNGWLGYKADNVP
jgi:hypothetical protein